MKYELSAVALKEIVGDETVVSLDNGNIVVLNEPAAIILEAALSNDSNWINEAVESLAMGNRDLYTRAKADVRKTLAQLVRCEVLHPVTDAAYRGRRPYKRVTRREFVAGMAASGLSLFAPHTALGDESATVAKRVYTGSYLVETNETDDSSSWVDSLGRNVVIPSRVKRVAPYGPYAQTVLESIDPGMVVHVAARGMHASLAVNAPKQEETLAEQDEGGAALNLDALRLSNPDVILDIAIDEAKLCTSIDSQAEIAGIPIMHIVIEDDELPQAYRSLGKLLGRKARCNELADYIGSIDVSLAQIREAIPEDERKRVYYGEGPDGLCTRGANTLLSQVVAKAGCINAGDGFGGKHSLSAADIIESKPDLCLIESSPCIADESIPVPALSVWSDDCLGANMQTYAVPELPTSWFSRSPLHMGTIGALWIAWLAHPAQFERDFTDIVSEYFQILFGYSLSCSEIEALLQESSDWGSSADSL